MELQLARFDYKRYSLAKVSGLLILTSLLIGTVQVYAADTPAIVRPDPLRLEVGLGQEETLTIVLENASEVYGIDIRAHFDPSGMEISDVDPAKDGIQMKSGNFIQPDFVVFNTADNEAGSLQYVTTQVNPTPPANGKGVVISIQVKGKKLGEYPFTIYFAEIADRKGNKLPIEMKNGVIQVVPAKPNTPTPIPTPTMPSETIAPVKTPIALPEQQKITTQKGSALHTQPPEATPTQVEEQKATLRAQTLKTVAIGGVSGASILFLAAVWMYFRRNENRKH
jgi:hypothetical protein